ncbi:MAG: response regulator [Pseudomonadota bacterium]
MTGAFDEANYGRELVVLCDGRELVVLCDGRDVIRFVSLSFAELFGAPPEAWPGKRFAPYATTPDHLNPPTLFRTSAETASGEAVIDWRLTAFDSGERLYAGRIAPERRRLTLRIGAPEESKGQRDIADQAHFIATMSHEMRTPLNGVIGMTNLLLDTSLDANQRSYVESIREAGGALVSLINDVLDYAKLRAGKLELEAAPFDPFHLVQNVTEMLAPRAAEKKIDLAGFTHPSTPQRLIGDENRIRQILINLAGNGVKFTETGGVGIEAFAKPRGNGEVDLTIVIRDTGVGIDKDQQAHIFEEFEQAVENGGRRAEGAGLGLAISRRLATALGGQISLRSKLGTGSEFTFTMRAKIAAVAAPRPDTGRAPILVATPSVILADHFRRQLTALGRKDFQVATTARAAADAIKAMSRPVFLCDYRLIDAIARETLAATARALAFIGADARNTISDLRDKGFDGYLLTPIRQSTLIRELSALKGEEASAHTDDARADPARTGAKKPGSKATARRDEAGGVRKKDGDDANAQLKLLLAEDNSINAVLATTLLRRDGHAVDIAENGVQAVEMCEKSVYDMVFMDMHMPQMDGLEATRRIRAKGGSNADAPIVALTANAMATDRRKCLAAGMDDFLTKPFDPADLVGMVAKWRGGRGLVAAS